MEGIRTKLVLDGNNGRSDRVYVYSEHYEETVWVENFPFGRRPPARVARMVERAAKRLLRKEGQRIETQAALKEKGIGQ